jgi:hypothetical protein
MAGWRREEAGVRCYGNRIEAKPQIISAYKKLGSGDTKLAAY